MAAGLAQSLQNELLEVTGRLVHRVSQKIGWIRGWKTDISSRVLPHLEPPFLDGVPHGVVVGHEPVLELQAGLPPGHRAVPAMDQDVGERLEKLGLR